MKRHILPRTSTFVVFLLLVSACELPQHTAAQPSSRSTRYARTAHPARRTMIEDVSFLGFVEPSQMVNVHFLVPGRVADCDVREGQLVRAGEPLCQLDDSAVRLEVLRAKNALDAARKLLETNLLEKQKALFDAGVIGQSEFEQVRLQTEGAKAQLQDAETVHEMALKKHREHTLTAPIDGKVARLLVKAGQPTSPEFPAAIILNEKTLQINANLHAMHFSRIHLGMTGAIARFATEDLSKPIPVQVADKATTVDPATQTFRVGLLVDASAKDRLASGLLVSGKLHIEIHEKALAVPQTALFAWKPSGEASTFVVEGGRLRIRDFRAGVLADGWIEVREGLRETDEVVTEIAPDFLPGLPVEPLDHTQTK